MIEGNVNEDDVLLYAQRLYFNNLTEGEPIDKIDDELNEADTSKGREFIENFSLELEESFKNLYRFYKVDSDVYAIHSLIQLGRIGLVMPFILKAYKFNIDKDTMAVLCKSFESLVLRHRVIGTRADIILRINDTFKNFTQEDTDTSVQSIVARINTLKESDSEEDPYMSHWNSNALKKALQEGIKAENAKFILWKYENFLCSQGKPGYKEKRFTDIEKPQLEHIAPQHPRSATPEKDGYAKYDDIFIRNYLNCIGNYLLLSGYHNQSLSNDPFDKKRQTYTKLEQQREVFEMTKEKKIWGVREIKKRRNKIIAFVLENF